MSGDPFKVRVLDALESIQGELRKLRGRPTQEPKLPPPNREAELRLFRKHARKGEEGQCSN